MDRIFIIHRLDFDDVELIQPTTAAGVCTATTNDQLTVVSPSTTLTGISNLCGTLTGSHSKEIILLKIYHM